jgi:hypothetical protein
MRRRIEQLGVEELLMRYSDNCKYSFAAAFVVVLLVFPATDSNAFFFESSNQLAPSRVSDYPTALGVPSLEHKSGTDLYSGRYSGVLMPEFQQKRPGRQRQEEEQAIIKEPKYRMAFGIGGHLPRRDLKGPFNIGTLMELILGYYLLEYIQMEGGMGYTTGFLESEGVVGFDAVTGRIVELRGSYLALPLGLKLAKGIREGSMNFAVGGGVLYNRYAQSTNLIDAFGLAARETLSRSGFGYYVNSTYDHFFSGQYGIGARVRYVRTTTSGENVGKVLQGEGEDYDPNKEGKTSDAWLSIAGALVYRF